MSRPRSGRTRSIPELSHVGPGGEARMVEVGAKAETEREAVASAIVAMRPETLALVLDGRAAKGDVLAVARVAGIQGGKRTSDLVPLCHPVRVTSIEISFNPDVTRGLLRISATARALDRTGVEMEALTAASVAALTVYDMLKAAERGIEIRSVRLEAKRGGKSGEWRRER